MSILMGDPVKENSPEIVKTNYPSKAPEQHSGVDSGMDSGVDSGMDSGLDSGVDSGLDSGPEILHCRAVPGS